MADSVIDIEKYPEMYYFMNESVSDVTFIIEGQPLPALKQLLSVKSKVFRAMFSGQFKETKEKEVPIEDTTFEAFKTMIHFIYTEKLVFEDKLNLKQIIEVYRLADRFAVIRLMDKIPNHLKSIISLKNLTFISRIAFDYSFDDLSEKVIKYIEKYINQLVRRDIKELIELNNSTKDRLLDLLTGPHLRLDKGLAEIYINGESMRVVKEFLRNKNVFITYCIFEERHPNCHSVTTLHKTSFDAFKTWIGFVYFDRLLFKDENDLNLIREVCELSQRFPVNGLVDKIGSHFENRITVWSFKEISRIAFDYKIDNLMAKVKEFIDKNFIEISVKNKKELIEINDFTNNSLLDIITENCRKLYIRSMVKTKKKKKSPSEVLPLKYSD